MFITLFWVSCIFCSDFIWWCICGEKFYASLWWSDLSLPIFTCLGSRVAGNKQFRCSNFANWILVRSMWVCLTLHATYTYEIRRHIHKEIYKISLQIYLTVEKKVSASTLHLSLCGYFFPSHRSVRCVQIIRWWCSNLGQGPLRT